MKPTSRLLLACVMLASAAPAWAQPRAYRLPAVDLKEPVIWGTVCEAPDGTALAFGGQDQNDDDGRPPTRLRQGKEWKSIRQELRAGNPLQHLGERAGEAGRSLKDVLARGRALYLDGLPREETATRVRTELSPRLKKVAEEVAALVTDLGRPVVARNDYEAAQAKQAKTSLDGAGTQLERVCERLSNRPLDADPLAQLAAAAILLERAAESLDAEPPPRALGPLVYEPKTKRFVLFGGDHFDYLTNDTWLFDPTQRRWQQRHPAAAPPPRANHTLKADGDGTVTLTGGYTYTSSTDYVGGQYRDQGDGDWSYDLAADTWKGRVDGVAPDQRVYRTGPFHPDFFLQGPRPDAAVFAGWLDKLPANTWQRTKPPQLPQLNRDWGTAVLDPDRDLILRWSGGHSAHGGTDVPHFHLASNRWELPCPVEFPLGQLYSNTSYPEGVSFNGRPWITGHTYQNYGYDPLSRQMLFLGQPRYFYRYDPDRGDWSGTRTLKPRELSYPNCFYTLTVTPTPHGLVCWTEQGKLFHLLKGGQQWQEVKLSGDKLPGAVVDNSTVVHDAKRDRLLFFRKPYGEKQTYDGQVHEVEWRTGRVRALSPKGMAAAGAIPYLCQIRSDAGQDLLLVGATLPPDVGGVRRTPAYDCAGDRWLSLQLGGEDPSGKTGRNVSLGLMYDARRKLFWAVDTHSQVYVLRLDRKTADERELAQPGKNAPRDRPQKD
jgi:hypothetical protein